MKIVILSFLICVNLCVFRSLGQEYHVLDYNLNGTAVHGVKIKTNLPYTSSSQMVTLNIEGYSYGTSSTIGLLLNYYIYNGNFISHSVSSFGGHTPDVYLTNEAGKVVVFVASKSYFQRFRVKAFARGMSEQAVWFQGWTAVDEAMSGTNTVKLSYRNRMAGDLFGENILLTGKLGIGTNSPSEKLSVNGNIRAREIKVETDNWPDYVFTRKYNLMPLADVEKFIQTKGHLPEIPQASVIEEEGISLGEMNKLLMKKIEELTLYVIEIDKENKKMKATLEKSTINGVK
ncbi:hypothetical protein FAZ19_22510 [Sphingobacterium alkalisoli]|uniref:Uncharacterized protein n=1 Tax=Sphingobacterium alkalisoli TaxID=1874115 RepID=A0A4U0GSV0_9SPHI|nr:hypothetical protein [Sphingobacterium alkalisoli]TJY60712.1 hypothetical protein FAZ19_22510 [Sphingobacterium alkalisoli]GGH31501.1 hypothetical protein GCM10011418_44350 [Sphingobacterium alkalisoli]